MTTGPYTRFRPERSHTGLFNIRNDTVYSDSFQPPLLSFVRRCRPLALNRAMGVPCPPDFIMRTLSCILLALAAIFFSVSAFSQSSPAKSPDSLPYSPSLDVSSLDRSVDPCVDLYHFACGGWQKKNPIPADQTSWSVYGKLYQDNLNFLRTILEQAASGSGTRTPVTQKLVISTLRVWTKPARKSAACPRFSRNWIQSRSSSLRRRSQH